MSNWEHCNTESNLLLKGGFEKLLNSEPIVFGSTVCNFSGNYIFSNKNTHYYTGEAEDIQYRLKQHLHIKSTFYNGYLKSVKDLANILGIKDFEVRVIKTDIGRKELEEFSIVNASTILNRFQLSKRPLFPNKGDKSFWDLIQQRKMDLLLEAQECFEKKAYQHWDQAVVIAGPGIYQIMHKDNGVIYIGESSNILDRVATHSKVTRFSAFRRSVATDILSLKLKLKTELGQSVTAKKDKRMYLSNAEDSLVNKYISECLIKTMNVSFGRYELEKHLIKTNNPLLNKKDNAH